jgi:hypothetical protein
MTRRAGFLDHSPVFNLCSEVIYRSYGTTIIGITTAASKNIWKKRETKTMPEKQLRQTPSHSTDEHAATPKSLACEVKAWMRFLRTSSTGEYMNYRSFIMPGLNANFYPSGRTGRFLYYEWETTLVMPDEVRRRLSFLFTSVHQAWPRCDGCTTSSDECIKALIARV